MIRLVLERYKRNFSTFGFGTTSVSLSQLKTIVICIGFQGVILDIDGVYRFLDKLNNQLKNQ